MPEERIHQGQCLPAYFDTRTYVNERSLHQLAADLKKDRKKTLTAEQISSWYKRRWRLYCAVRARQNHTGGCDGDEFRVTIEDDEDGTNGEDTPTEEREASAAPKEEENDSLPTENKKKGAKFSAKFSAAQMDKFEQSELYQLFDRVYVFFFLLTYNTWLSSTHTIRAHDHPTVVKLYAISSDKPIKEDEATEDKPPRPLKRKRSDEEDGVEELLAGGMQSLSADQDRRYEIQAEILRLKNDKARREEEEAERRKVMHRQELIDKKWMAYHESLKHTDEFSKRQTELLMREIEELGGI